MSASWNPTASIENLRARADCYRTIREFFHQRQVLEVETPVLSVAAVVDPNIEPMQTTEQRYLHTSPEYAMKRLLCAGSGDIYQICKVFRAGEAGSRHNPEFTMLEWYRLGWDHFRLINEVAELVRLLLDQPQAAMEIHRYRDAVSRFAGLDPFTATDDEIAALGIQLAGQDLQLGRDGWLDVIVSHQVEPALPANTLVFIHDFPASQAALAKTRVTAEGIAVAERFELFWNGSEMANGYHELTDVVEQRHRFEQQADGRPLDEQLLAALRHGLPACAGVAMGLDRILMHRLQTPKIRDVLAFDWFRA
ncbi:EF-P lysine aminoacylase EpmA [Oceanobacter mangrovi]|uniref:EF-P lysine aminoacylase EpmA n=1 Tax=Oceanobacter mangrovi TaxID=2862510 RepID=UPI001C8EFDC1|nr:EF-P lysine aminoacylase EpmA [Oceanobacter mangrovi]